MSPILTFFVGLGILILLGLVFCTDSERRRRIIGTVLTIAITAFCLCVDLSAVRSRKTPTERSSAQAKFTSALTFKVGLLSLIRLEPIADTSGIENGRSPSSMVEQAIEAIRKRVDQFGVSEPIITPQGNDRILVQIPGLDAAEKSRGAPAAIARGQARIPPRLSR